MGETSKTVNHALEVLNCFSRSRPVLKGSEIVEELGLPRTNVLRLLSTLENAGFIAREERGLGYRIGLRAFEIGTLYLTGNPQLSMLTKVLDDLVDKTGCTAYLGVLDRDDLMILAYREGTVPIRFIWKEGDRLPCTTTALGKAILMHLPSDEITQHLGDEETLRGLTERSLQTRSELDAELNEFRKLGWAIAQEESHAGIWSVGCPVLDGNRYPIAALSVCFVDYPPDQTQKEKYANFVLEAARNASSQVAEFTVYGRALLRESIVR